MAGTTTIRVALDWTPNTIHSGLYCALEKDFYQEQGLTVQLLPPDTDYSITPAKRLQKGEVELAICPSESVIAYNETGRMKLQAIYAILLKDASAIVSTNLQSVAALGEGIYGSYNARYEDSIVKAMVNAAIGKGEGMKIKNSTGKLSLFDEVKNGEVDATWVFMPWEGVEAARDGVKLYHFKTEDYGVPYGYSPVIVRNAESSLSSEALKKFVAATAKGYEYAIQNPENAAATLSPHCQPTRSLQFLEESQTSINVFYGGQGPRLGYMESDKWQGWMDWLSTQGLLKQDLSTNDLFTNEYFA